MQTCIISLDFKQRLCIYIEKSETDENVQENIAQKLCLTNILLHSVTDYNMARQK